MNPAHTLFRLFQRAFLCGPVFLLFSSMLSTTALGYQVQSTAEQAGNKVARWYNLPVPIELHLDGAPDIKDGSDLRAIREALQSWTQPQCNNLTFAFETTNNTSFAGRRKDPNDPLSEFTRDGKSVIRFETQNWEWSQTEVARNATYFDPQTGAIKEADLLFNAVHFKWSTDQSPGTLDIQTVALIRGGFMLGLWFSEVPGALLHGSTDLRRTHRSLSQDDIDGSCFLYPTSGWNNSPPPAPKENPALPEPTTGPEPPTTQDANTTGSDTSVSVDPDLGAPSDGVEGSGGCQCHSTNPLSGTTCLFLFMVVACVWRQRRRSVS